MTATSEIAFHFNPRRSQQCIVRNSQLGGSWGQEEQDGGYPFTPGALFDILILFEQESFLTAVNGIFLKLNNKFNSTLISFFTFSFRKALLRVRLPNASCQCPQRSSQRRRRF